MTCTAGQALLDPFIDGELGIERSLDFERHLQGCPSCAAELARRRTLGASLRSKLGHYSAPPELHRALRKELARAEAASVVAASARPQAQRAWMRMAASLILVAGVSSALTFYGLQSRGDIVADEVFASYVRGVQSGDRLVDVLSTDRHKVKPWLDARLDFAVTVKDLSSDGLPLTGGRVDYIDGHSVAALVYRSGQHAITLFMWPGGGQISPVATGARRGDSLAWWSDGAMTYWAISDLEAQEVTDFAKRFQAAAPMTSALSSEE